MNRAADSPAARRAAFEAEALPHAERLYRVALRFAGRPADAADLVQETYLRAYRTFDGYQRGTNARAWLLTILYSVFANRYRQARRRPGEVSLDDVEGRWERELASDDWTSAANLERTGTWGTGQEVEAALRRVPDDFREAVVLVDLEELSYEEAAAVIGCPVGTVRSRLYRGRRRLAALLHEYAANLGYTRR